MSLGDLGDLVKGQTCPRCQQFTVVYSGNYFCGNPNCSWAMGESHRPVRIVRAYLLQRRAEAEAQGDEREVARMDLYLKNYPVEDV
jgi:hypothetical protein